MVPRYRAQRLPVDFLRRRADAQTRDIPSSNHAFFPVYPITAFRQRRATTARFPALLLALGPLVGLASVALFNRLSSGAFFTFVSVQSEWERRTDGLGLVESLGKLFCLQGNLADLTGGFLSVLSLPLLFFLLPRSLAFYSLVISLLPLSTGRIISMGRFTSFDFPVFLALGALLSKKPRLLWSVACIFALLQLVTAQSLITWVFTG